MHFPNSFDWTLYYNLCITAYFICLVRLTEVWHTDRFIWDNRRYILFKTRLKQTKGIPLYHASWETSYHNNKETTVIFLITWCRYLLLLAYSNIVLLSMHFQWYVWTYFAVWYFYFPSLLYLVSIFLAVNIHQLLGLVLQTALSGLLKTTKVLISSPVCLFHGFIIAIDIKSSLHNFSSHAYLCRISTIVLSKWFLVWNASFFML